MVSIEITDKPFDPWKEVADYQARNSVDGEHGATTVFVGTMRDFNEGDAVEALELEHYEGMTDEHLSEMAESLMTQYDLLDVMLIHRIGKMHPGEPIVLVAVWSAHRAESFKACSVLVEDLKSKAPFWKKEHLKGGKIRWVEHNTVGPGNFADELQEVGNNG